LHDFQLAPNTAGAAMTKSRSISSRFRCLSRWSDSAWKLVLRSATLLLMLSVLQPALAETENGIEDTALYLETLAKSLESELASQTAELAELEVQMQELAKLQNRIQAETWTYDSQNTAHKQLLLMSSLRIVDLANAIKDNRMASRKVSEHIELLQQQLDSASVFLQRATASNWPGSSSAILGSRSGPKKRSSNSRLPCKSCLACSRKKNSSGNAM
jgi:hypothetical protein